MPQALGVISSEFQTGMNPRTLLLKAVKLILGDCLFSNTSCKRCLELNILKITQKLEQWPSFMRSAAKQTLQMVVSCICLALCTFTLSLKIYEYPDLFSKGKSFRHMLTSVLRTNGRAKHIKIHE